MCHQAAVFLKVHLFYIILSVLLAYTCVQHMDVGCTQWSEEGFRSLGTEAMDG